MNRFVVYISVFFITMSVMTFETILLKFFSFKLVNSWAFLVLSTAFLGIGVSGTYLYLKKSSLNINFYFLSRINTFYVISIPIMIIIFSLIPFGSLQQMDNLQEVAMGRSLMYCLLFILMFSIPFFLSGISISYLLSLKELPAGKVLFFDLFGASIGSILTILLIRPLGGYGVLLCSMASGYVATLCFSYLSIKTDKIKPLVFFTYFLPVILGIILCIYPSLAIRWYGYDIITPTRESINMTRIFKGPEVTYWNPISRIDISKENCTNNYMFLFGLSRNYYSQNFTGRYISLDNGAATRQFRIDANNEKKDFLEHFLPSIPYKTRDSMNNVLIIGPGGGLDILVAKHFKSKNVDAVDINSDIIHLLTTVDKKDKMSQIYTQFTTSNDITGIHYYNEEGRAFLTKTPQKHYDLVQLTGVDLLSVLSSGGMLLSESYLYTLEAFEYYYNALNDDGTVQICYWTGPYVLKLFNTALAMLKSKGVQNPEQSLFVMDDGNSFATLFIKKGRFTSAELEKMSTIAREDKFAVLFNPNERVSTQNIHPSPINSQHFNLAAYDNESLPVSTIYDLTPTTDDMPFFYSIYNGRLLKYSTWFIYIFFQNKFIWILSCICILLSIGLIIVPLLVNRIKSTKQERIPLTLVFFYGLIGLGFSIIELVILQKFIIFIGGPLYSMCITLPIILIFYSIGAYTTSKVKSSPYTVLFISIMGILLFCFLGYLYLDGIIKQFFFLSHIYRVIVTILIIAPLGLLIGFPIPVAIEFTKKNIGRDIVPWLWGTNSCGNVIGSILFFPLSRTIGFNFLLVWASCTYLLAFALLSPLLKKVPITNNQ